MTADLTDRQLVHALGLAVRRLTAADRAARPNRARINAGREQVRELRAELAERLAADTAFDYGSIGIDVEPERERRVKGSGSVMQSGDRWIAKLVVEGQRVRKTFGSKADAEAWLTEARSRPARGQELRESRLTVAGWLDHCVSDVWPGEGLSAGTIRNHRDGIERWWRPHLGNVKLTALQPADVRSVLRKMDEANLAPNTKRIAVTPLKKALNLAVLEEMVTRNVAAIATRKQRIEKVRETKFLTPDEARALLAACPGDTYGDAIALSMLLGLRRGECLGLPWDAVTLDGDRPHVVIRQQITTTSGGPVRGTKTGSGEVRTIILPSVAVAVLRRRQERQRFEERTAGDAWHNEHGLVFTTKIGTPLGPRNYSHGVDRLTAKVIGRKVGAHALRHTAATLLHEAGVPMKVIQEVLGHRTIEITSQVYTHTLDAQHDRAAAALDALYTGEADEGPDDEGGALSGALPA